MRKQLDPRIPILINNNVKLNHRSFVVLVGDKGRDQVGESLSLTMQLVKTVLPDCKSSLSPLPSTCIRTTICIMVLQKRTGVHEPSQEKGGED